MQAGRARKDSPTFEDGDIEFDDDDIEADLKDSTLAKNTKIVTSKMISESEFNLHLLGHIKKRYLALATQDKDLNFFEGTLAVTVPEEKTKKNEHVSAVEKPKAKEPIQLPYFVIENLKTGKRHVIFNVTKDIADQNKASGLLYSVDVIKAYQNLPQESEPDSRIPKEDSTLLVPIRQSETTLGLSRAHIVLAEIPLQGKNFFIHDSQGNKSKAYESTYGLITSLGKKIGKTCTSIPYDKQKKDYECAHYVHRYIDSILLTGNSASLKDISIDAKDVADKEAVFKALGAYDRPSAAAQNIAAPGADDAKKDHKQPTPNEIPLIEKVKEKVRSAIKKEYEDYGDRHHDARVADFKKFLNNCQDIEKIKIVLQQQKGLYEGVKFIFDLKDIRDYPALFKTLSWAGKNKGKYYKAICAAYEAAQTLSPDQKVENGSAGPAPEQPSQAVGSDNPSATHAVVNDPTKSTSKPPR